MQKITFVLAVLASAAPALAQQGQPGGHFIESWDTDADGTVSLEDIETRRSDVFYMFDANEDGVLDAEEYTHFDAARANDMEVNGGHGQGDALRRAAEGMTLAFNDSDGDGDVTQEEFIAHAGDWMALLDRDGDGLVSTSDFGRN